MFECVLVDSFARDTLLFREMETEAKWNSIAFPRNKGDALSRIYLHRRAALLENEKVSQSHKRQPACVVVFRSLRESDIELTWLSLGDFYCGDAERGDIKTCAYCTRDRLTDELARNEDESSSTCELFNLASLAKPQIMHGMWGGNFSKVELRM